jgi:uncharacterized membrane protein (UPF0127 family)
MGEKKHVKIIRRETGDVVLKSARWCESRLCRLRGLQFSKSPKPGEGLLMVMPQESIATTSIHMFFVFFPIAAVWINNQGLITHATLAKPWRPYYASPSPARYVLETTPDFLERISVGDEVDFV